jgi:hypothetical protein
VVPGGIAWLDEALGSGACLGAALGDGHSGAQAGKKSRPVPLRGREENDVGGKEPRVYEKIR